MVWVIYSLGRIWRRGCGAILQVQLNGQLQLRNRFHCLHHRAHIGHTIVQAFVTMGAILILEKTQWHDRLPERVIPERLEPRFDVINIIERRHSISIPNQALRAQI